MSTTAVRTPAQYEEEVRRYLFERSEEARAVRVGEKETSEQAAIVARYAGLFTREQLAALSEAEAAAGNDDRERLARQALLGEAGLVVSEVAEQQDALENAVLASRVTFRGDELPLRAAQAKLALLDAYADREELGRLALESSAALNDDRLALLRAVEEL